MPEPTPSPTPTPAPTPAPSPTPTPEPTPTPTPAPSPTPAPTPEPTPAPADDWRKAFALDDAAKMGKLQRYSSPADFAKAHWAAVDKVLEGQKHQPLPKDATPEQVAQWRQANGIPDKPEGYELKLKDGLVIGEQDKPLVDSFLKVVHDRNGSPEFASDVVNWYFENQEAQIEARAEADSAATDAAEASLRDEWGPEYKKNMGISYAFLGRFPETVRDLLKNGRLADGNPIFANQEIIKAFATFEREINPAASVLPGGGGDSAKDIETELDGLKKRMGEDPNWSKDTKAHQRFLELVEAQERVKRRAA